MAFDLARHNAVVARGMKRARQLEAGYTAALQEVFDGVADEVARRFERQTLVASARRADLVRLAALGPDAARGLLASLALTAAGDGVTSASTMVCVKPTAAQAAALADGDGAPPESLHVTLCYLGEVEGDLDPVVAALGRVAASHAPLEGTVAGYGQFVTPGGNVGILLPDVPGLVELRCAVADALVGAGVDYSRTHGFEAHITVDWSPESDEAAEMLAKAGSPLSFGSLYVVRGDVEQVELPLTGPRPLTAATSAVQSADLAEHAVAFDDAKREETDAERALEQAQARDDAEKVALAERRLAAAKANVRKLQSEKPKETPPTTDVLPDTSAEPSQPLPGPNLVTDQLQDKIRDQIEPEKVAGDVKLQREAAIAQEVLQVAGWEKPAIDELLNSEALAQRLQEVSNPVAHQIVKTVGGETVGHVGIAFDVKNPYVARALEKTGAQITDVAKTTQVDVVKAVGAAYDQGLPIPEAAKSIRAAIKDASPARARLIARTEMVAAVNGGSFAATQMITEATGQGFSKTWLTAPGAVYPRHETYDGLDGQTVALDEAFDVGGEQLLYPGDPDGDPGEVCNCRCAMSYGDAAAAQEEEPAADPRETAPPNPRETTLEAVQQRQLPQSILDELAKGKEQPGIVAEATGAEQQLSKQVAGLDGLYGDFHENLEPSSLAALDVFGTVPGHDAVQAFARGELGAKEVGIYPKYLDTGAKPGEVSKSLQSAGLTAGIKNHKIWLDGQQLTGLMDDALAQAPALDAPMSVFSSYRNSRGLFGTGPVVGQTYREAGYLSASIDQKVAEGFLEKAAPEVGALSKPVVMELQVPAGTKGLWGRSYHWPEQNLEYTLARGQSVVVDAAQDKGKYTQVVAHLKSAEGGASAAASSGDFTIQEVGHLSSAAMDDFAQETFDWPEGAGEVAGSLIYSANEAGLTVKTAVAKETGDLRAIIGTEWNPSEERLMIRDVAAAGGGGEGKALVRDAAATAAAKGYGLRLAALDDQAESYWKHLGFERLNPGEAQRIMDLSPDETAAFAHYEPVAPAAAPAESLAVPAATGSPEAQAVADTTVGITPFRPEDMLPASTLFYDTARAKQFEADLEPTATKHGVTITGMSHTTGVWEGETEPSYSLKAHDGPTGVHDFAEEMRAKYNQTAVMLFTPGAGADVQITVDKIPKGALPGRTANERALYFANQLKEHGVLGATIQGGRLHVAASAADAEEYAKTVRGLAESVWPPEVASAQISYTRGQLTFVSREPAPGELVVRPFSMPSADETSALIGYQGPSYKQINGALRNYTVSQLSVYDQRAVDGIDSALARNTLQHDMNLYRGLDYHGLRGIGGLEAVNNPSSLVGKTIEDPAFFSTSKSMDVASGFGTEAVLEIKAPAGMHGLDFDLVPDLTNRYGEREVLLPRGTQLRITGVRESGEGFGILEAVPVIEGRK